MITTTVADLLDDNLNLAIEDACLSGRQGPGKEIYVVRDSDVVFYVGQSSDVLSRLNEHIGLAGRRGPTSPSHLGRVILDNLPESRGWIIELWSVEDCKRELAGEKTKRWRWDRILAEEQMILARRPYLNATKNPYERQLPERYYPNIQADAIRRRPPAVYEFDLNSLSTLSPISNL